MFFFWRSGRSMQYHTFATLSSKLCTKKIPMVSEFLMSSRHHSCTSVAVPALPTCNLSVHSYLGKPPRSYTKKVSATSRCQLNGYELRGKSQSLPKSDCVLSPSSLSGWYLFWGYQVFSPYSCVCVVSCHIWCFFSESLFSIPLFFLEGSNSTTWAIQQHQVFFAWLHAAWKLSRAFV